MAEGQLRAMRSMVVAQAMLFSASATGRQIANFIATGSLECTPVGAEPPPMPYDADALKSLVASGRLAGGQST